ncbi:MAG: nucleotidyltransferase family protein [Pseudomonadota bacterium]
MGRDTSLTFSSENKLLLLFSLVSLTSVQKDEARKLLADLPDLYPLLETAARNYALPTVARHLRDLDALPQDADQRREIDETLNRQGLHNLRMVHALSKFVAHCIEPAGIDFVVFKGVTLAHQYYPDVGLRPCRDIDIAVRPEHLERLVRIAIEAGYILRAPNGRGGAITEERDIRALMTYARSAVLISSEGIAIDLQPGIDKFSGIFDGIDVLGNPHHLDLGGRHVPVLSDALVFNYLCHHHARHLWSKLHWITDIDAVLKSPGFDLAKSLQLADLLGQRGTVDGTLQLHALASDPGSWRENTDRAHAHGAQFLRLCLENLAGDVALEKRIAMGMIGGEFMYPWQATPELLQRARRNWLRAMLRPSFHQYQSLPLPRQLQWLYYPSRLWQLVFGGMARRFIP